MVYFNVSPNRTPESTKYMWSIDPEALQVVDEMFEAGASFDDTKEVLHAHLRERKAPSSVFGDYSEQAEVHFLEQLIESSKE